MRREDELTASLKCKVRMLLRLSSENRKRRGLEVSVSNWVAGIAWCTVTLGLPAMSVTAFVVKLTKVLIGVVAKLGLI